jgi:hypothetical protein
MQLIEDGGYGFELLRETIASYKSLSADQMPQTDDDKIQRWVIQQSNVARCNLYEYYKQWGWTMIEATNAPLAGLPVYPKCGK